MLELKNVVKEYPAGNGKVSALKGINLRFRKSEFVAALGPSGCGKTTLLNIIGGLDHYTSGDLIISGKSTKDFTDREWDAYRNHSVGFVFQSYNLIPHQTALQNVELSLTLTGVPKSERRRRAQKALEDVGLLPQINKRPNEMSGGQMQRVAIARALVNDPDIILADEPTGALDTETSIQIMEIMKAISKDRLVVMVTHNPDLAEKYSTRIIRMLDGEITSDTMPISDEEYEKELEEARKDRKEKSKLKMPSMSLWSSFSLSLKNLFTKKGRTILTSFAGSIGIIGIALILSISRGMTKYINETQENALSSYPLAIESTTVDLTSLMNAFMNVNSGKTSHGKDEIYKKSAIYNMVNALNNLETRKNDLVSFKKYIEAEMEDKDGKFYKAVNGIQYTYSLPLYVYTKNVDGSIIRSDTAELMSEILYEYMGMNMSSASSGGMFSLGSGTSSSTRNMWQEALRGTDGELINELLYNQYDLLYGEWPDAYDEIAIVVDKNNELDDLTLYALGLEPKEQIDKIMKAATEKTELEKSDDSWSYEEVCNREYKVILNSSCYSYDEENGRYIDLRDTEAGLRYLYDNGIDLKVTGIIRPNKDAAATMLTGSILYTEALTEYIIAGSAGSEAVKAQKENEKTDVITGLPFKDTASEMSDEEKRDEFKNYIRDLNDNKKAELYIKIMSIPDEEQIKASVDGVMAQMTREMIENSMIEGLSGKMGVGEEVVREYVETMSDEDIYELFRNSVEERFREQYAAGIRENLSKMSVEELVFALESAIDGMTDEQCVKYYDETVEFSSSDYESNLKMLGYVDLDDPATINIFASSFENKNVIEDKIAEYNRNTDEMSRIKYTDYVRIIMSSVTTIIKAITYILIAFVAISLIVSSIMIGVITLISVQERTKEIGILRAIGASKKEVAGMFNVETMIIGFAAGAIGVLMTCIICVPINLIIHLLTGIKSLSAFLPVTDAIILIVISVLLTLVSGLIPSRSAAKKDPVVALRTE